MSLPCTTHPNQILALTLYLLTIVWHTKFVEYGDDFHYLKPDSHEYPPTQEILTADENNSQSPQISFTRD